MGKLTGKKALITGGGRGIGRGIALSFARAGADLAIADVDEMESPFNQYMATKVGGFDHAVKTADEVVELGQKGIAIAADVRKKYDAVRMVEEAVNKLGGLDILVCNAGVINLSSVEAMPEEMWDLTMAVNVKGVFLSCQAAIPHLKKSKGCIINIASVAGKDGVTYMSHYCASKFAVVGFTNALAKELAPHGIRVNAICPGIIRTQMWEYLAESFKRPGESREESWQRNVRKLIPLGRPQTPEDIGELALYLATANNVTGQAINLDGGMELH
ncbi:MAG: SDR family NAD(P)-dependent oxidoreductase [Candidatus Bathyarchaeia archaeon]